MLHPSVNQPSGRAPVQSCSFRHPELCKSTGGFDHFSPEDSAKRVVRRPTATLSLSDREWPIRYSHGNPCARAGDLGGLLDDRCPLAWMSMVSSIARVRLHRAGSLPHGGDAMAKKVKTRTTREMAARIQQLEQQLLIAKSVGMGLTSVLIAITVAHARRLGGEMERSS